jgi:flagellar assembly protein FliH
LSIETAAATVAAYSFRQLESTAEVPMRDITDVIGAAYGEAEQIREEARREGEAQGRADGIAAFRADAEQALAALTQAVSEVHRLRDEVSAELERDAVALALRLAEQIVAGAIEVQPERMLDVAAQAMRRITDRRHVTLVINPADLDLVNSSVEGLQAELGGIEHCNVQADRRVGRGGVLAHTEAGEIDATIETQLARAREIVAAELAEGSGDDG